MTVTCPLCASCFANLSIFMTHLKLIHSNEHNFNIRCNLQGCQRTFVNFHTYRNHVYSMHSRSIDICEDNESRSTHIQDISENDSINTAETAEVSSEINLSALEPDDDLQINSLSAAGNHIYIHVATYNNNLFDRLLLYTYSSIRLLYYSI